MAIEVERPEGTTEELTEQIGKLMDRAGELQKEVAEGNRSNSEIKAELTDEIKPRLNELHEAREEAKAKEANEALLAEMRQIASEVRHPSKASLIGMGRDPNASPRADFGELIQNVWTLKGAVDPAAKSQALANLQAMGSRYAYAPAESQGGIS